MFCSFKNFFPSVIETLNFNRTITLVLTCPPYLIAGVFSVAASVSSGRFNERTWHITVCKAIAILGFVLAPATMSTPVRCVLWLSDRSRASTDPNSRYVAMCIFTSECQSFLFVDL